MNIFKLSGNVWQVCFSGDTSFYMAASQGMKYIHSILSRKANPVAAKEIIAEFSLRDPKKHPQESAVQAKERAETVAVMKEDYNSLMQEIEEARENEDEPRMLRLKHECEELARKVNGSSHVRIECLDVRRAREAVAKSVKRAVAMLEKHDMRLAEHLSYHLHVRATCSYTGKIDWECF